MSDLSKPFQALAVEEPLWRDFFLMVLFTDARPGNVASMQWSEGAEAARLMLYCHGTPEWDLRTRSPSFLGKRAAGVLLEGLRGGNDRQLVEAAVEALKLPWVRSAGRVEFAYLFTWFAFIRWHLAPKHAKRFRSDWKGEFAPEFDQLRSGRGVHTGRRRFRQA